MHEDLPIEIAEKEKIRDAITAEIAKLEQRRDELELLTQNLAESKRLLGEAFQIMVALKQSLDQRERQLNAREAEGRAGFARLFEFVSRFDAHVQQLLAQGIHLPERPALPSVPATFGEAP